MTEHIHPLAARLGELQVQLAATESALEAAANKVLDIQRKQADIKAQQREISARRIAGTSTDQDAAELEALTTDAALLTEMLTSAVGDQKRADPHDLRAAVSQAEHDWNHHLHGERLAALAGKAKEVDALLLRLIADIRQAGAAVGKHQLAECWTPSRALYECVGREFAPQHITR